MLIQEIKAVYYNDYEEPVTSYLFMDIPVTEEKVKRYCAKLLRSYKSLVSFEPYCLYKVEFDDLIELCNSKSLTDMEPYYPFIER